MTPAYHPSSAACLRLSLKQPVPCQLAGFPWRQREGAISRLCAASGCITAALALWAGSEGLSQLVGGTWLGSVPSSLDQSPWTQSGSLLPQRPGGFSCSRVWDLRGLRIQGSAPNTPARLTGCVAAMAPYRVRQYEDRDYEAVRAMFAQGMLEHVSAGYLHVLRRPQVQLFFWGLFLAVLVASGSLLVSLAALALAVAGSWFGLRSLWTSYVQQALGSDLRDIRRTYLEAADSCLWVAESDGAAVGMVAAVLPEDPSERGSALQLKRMSVAREYRGQGIARALSMTVIRFAQERGYSRVVLGTSMVQSVAQQLYESLGFRKVWARPPSALARFLQFSIFYYRYEIPGAR